MLYRPKSNKAPAGNASIASATRRGLSDHVVWRPLTELRPYPHNARKHPQAQIERLMRAMKAAFTNPVLIDENDTILAGHGRLEAAKRLAMSNIATLTFFGLSEAEKRSVVIADNRIPEQATWDFQVLKSNFSALIDIDFDVELTGFTTGEVDLIIDESPEPEAETCDETFSVDGPAVSRLGDKWLLGAHSILCADAQLSASYRELMGNVIAQMVVSDFPYNVKMSSVVSRGKIRHREFKMASGEMSRDQFAHFLASIIRNLIDFSANGSIHYLFMDWRHLLQLQLVAEQHYYEQKNLLIWNKSNAGQGSFYRSKHETIAVYKNSDAPHINNFKLGATGRHRSNVLDYPGVNTLNPNRRQDLELHPTVKPVALIADLIRDCSRRNGIILDPCSGSGVTLLAAERTGRVARLMEIDPLYVDVTIRRWEKVYGKTALLSGTNHTFADVARARLADTEDSSKPKPSHEVQHAT
jgi:DNA modification methylase